MKVKEVISSLINQQFSKLEMMSPVIIRVSDFTEETAKKFQVKISAAHNTGQKVIPIVIDSYGGSVYALLTMISAIKNAELPVATIIEGKAMSCGSILASFGTEGMRFADVDSTMMIHDVSSFGSGKIEDLKAATGQADVLHKKVFKMMAQNCGKKDDYFLDLIHEKSHAEWYLDAKEMKEHNLINHIRVPNFTINIKASIDFE